MNHDEAYDSPRQQQLRAGLTLGLVEPFMAIAFVVDSKSHTSTCGHESIAFGHYVWHKAVDSIFVDHQEHRPRTRREARLGYQATLVLSGEFFRFFRSTSFLFIAYSVGLK